MLASLQVILIFFQKKWVGRAMGNETFYGDGLNLPNRMDTLPILPTVMTHIVVDKSKDHAKPHSICFFTTISKITKETFVKSC